MRCNLVIPSNLTDQHLIAEKRELRMIPSLLERKLKTQPLEKILVSIPYKFCLGHGHMNFWLNKFLFLENRYYSLVEEIRNRGFHPDTNLKLDITLARQFNLYNDWNPSLTDIQISKIRIREKLLMKPFWYKFYSKPISIDWIDSIYN